MTDKLEVTLEYEGIPASVVLEFTFDGDWANLYRDTYDTEEEARNAFIREVGQLLASQ